MLAAASLPHSANRVSLAVVSVSDTHRQILEDWDTQLAALIGRQKACPARERNSSLRAQFGSAIHATHEAIAAACAEPKGHLIDEAIAAVARYFPKRGDARAAVLSFPAVVDAHFFLMGPESATSLADLAQQAEGARELIRRILACGEVWSFIGAAG